MALIYRSSAFDEFLFIRSRINNAVAYSTAMVKYKDVDITPFSAALSIPSVNDKLAIIPDMDDYTVFVYANRLLIYSLEPADGSARKHVSFYTGRYNNFTFTSTGSMLGFSCSVRGCNFSSLKCIPQGAMLAAESPAIF